MLLFRILTNTGKINDRDGDYIPDEIEDAVEDVKEEVAEAKAKVKKTVRAVKRKAKRVKEELGQMLEMQSKSGTTSDENQQLRVELEKAEELQDKRSKRDNQNE